MVIYWRVLFAIENKNGYLCQGQCHAMFRFRGQRISNGIFFTKTCSFTLFNLFQTSLKITPAPISILPFPSLPLFPNKFPDILPFLYFSAIIKSEHSVNYTYKLRLGISSYNIITAKKHAKPRASSLPSIASLGYTCAILLKLSGFRPFASNWYCCCHLGKIQVTNPAANLVAGRLRSYPVAINYLVPSSGFQVAACTLLLIQPSAISSSLVSSTTPMISVCEEAEERPPRLRRLRCSWIRAQLGQVCRSAISSAQEATSSREASLPTDTSSRAPPITPSLLLSASLAGLLQTAKSLPLLSLQA